MRRLLKNITKSLSKRIVLGLVIVVIVVGCFGAVAIFRNKDSSNRKEIIVMYKSQASGEAVKNRLKDKLDTSRELKYSNSEVIKIRKNDNVNEVIKELQSDPDVAFVQPDYKLYPTSTAEGSKLAEQWALDNYGQEVGGTEGSKGVDINVINAWQNGKGSPSVVVGVIDTGIDINHKDLKNNIFINSKEIPGNGIDDDGNGYVDDINGWDFAANDSSVYDSQYRDAHGTHIAGIIAADGNSGGVSGVAPNVKILPLKFIDGKFGYTSDAIEAIGYAKAMGVKIINCSWGSSEDNPALKKAMEDSGILFVCAAGDEGNDVTANPIYPAYFNLPNVVSVAAVDSYGVIAPFSSYGNGIHVAAPGVNILSTVPENKYALMSGTSMAAPFVTGTAALLESYDPSISVYDMSARIRANVTPSSNLKGKVDSGGIINACYALTNTFTTSIGSTDVNGTSSSGSGGVVTPLAIDVSPQLLEQIHYGENGVSPATGNYSSSYTDMTMATPGFQINISRTYNSKDDRPSSSFGRGWTFGFESNLKVDPVYTNIMVAKLMNGAVQTFTYNGSTFTANDSRSTLVKQSDNSFVLTTKDQYSYGYNPYGWLTWMKDKNGNTINIQVDSTGRVMGITDFKNRKFTVKYNGYGFIESITDPIGRKVSYEYENGLLLRVIDPMGNVIKYSYDTSKYITEVRDGASNLVESITYNHMSGQNQHKVTNYTDKNGNTFNFDYDSGNKKTTITDVNGRIAVKYYDANMYITSTQDPDGKVSSAVYNNFGEETSITDRNGNATSYTRDALGNITQVNNPDGSSRQYTYDSKNNLISEKDELGKLTFYVYDAQKVNLIKKAQPLNGTDQYSDTADQTKFAITVNTYYSDSEVQELGYMAKGLLKSVKDPEGNTTTYTYDDYGNIVSETDAEGNTTSYQYNLIGLKTAEISPIGHTTTYDYDLCGRLIRIKLDGGEITRIVYDSEGRVSAKIPANLYNPNMEDFEKGTYSGLSGYRYEYYPNGKIKTETDPMNKITTYSYDKYGNLETEVKPNEAVYIHEYDAINRPVKNWFKDPDKSTADLLEEYSYTVLPDKKTQVTFKKYLNEKESAVTVSKYDYADRLIEKQNPDGTKLTYTYNANGTLSSSADEKGSITSIKYDGLNRQTEKWVPLEMVNGSVKYTYSKTEYDKVGKKITEKTGKGKADINTAPDGGYISKSYVYYKNGKVRSVTDSDGGRTDYQYDADGNTIREDVYTSPTQMITTEYQCNYFGKVSVKKQHVKAGDLYGNSMDNADDTEVITTYSYDKNGNLKSVKSPDGTVTSYGYDALDRLILLKQPGKNEYDRGTSVTSKKTYDWAGNILTSTDANGNTTTYTYNNRGWVTLTTNPKGGVTAYHYDLSGRKTAEVSPNNYSSIKKLEEMNRTEYTYDIMDRVLTKVDRYLDTDSGRWMVAFSKVYKYDECGNVVKELDPLGYDVGTGLTLDSKISTGYGTEYKYNLANKLVSSLDAVSKERKLKFTVKYEYDGAGRKISETNANGVVIAYVLNDAGKVLATKVKKTASDAEKTMGASSYGLAGNVISETDGNGNTTTYEYNTFGKPSKVTYPGDDSIGSNVVQFQYDEMGNLKKKQDSVGSMDLYNYDNQGKEISHTQKKSNGKEAITTSTKYDLNGNKRFVIDGNGVKTENIYDALNMLVSTSVTVTGMNNTKSVHKTVYTYDANRNQLTSQVFIDTMNINKSTSSYNPLNRLIAKKDTNGNTIQRLQYNKNGVQIKSWDALGNVTTFYYDKANRLIKTVDSEGHITSQAYDNVGDVSVKYDGRNNKTTYAYDELKRLISVTNAKGETTKYTYDNNGNMLLQIDGNGNVATFEYNVSNKVVRKIDNNGRLGSAGSYGYLPDKTESYTYNPDGTVKTMVDRNGNTTTYIYDAHKRLISKECGNRKVTYTYDGNGNQTTITDETGKTIRAYDELNRVRTKSVPEAGTSIFVYDITTTGSGQWNVPDGHLPLGYVAETSKDPKGNITYKIKDNVGRLREVIADGKATTYNYNDDGSTKSVVYPNGSKEEYTYSKDGMLKTLVNKKADGTVIDSYTYTYDAAHNQTSKIDKKGTTSYTYDKLNRLETVSEPGGNTKYTYDKAGNRLTETAYNKKGSSVITYTYDDQNRLVSTSTKYGDGSTGTTEYSYDYNGNTTGKVSEGTKPSVNVDEEEKDNSDFDISITEQENGDGDSDVISYAYDEFNQMIRTSSGGKTSAYKYNGEGQRVEKNTGGKTTRYIYEADKVVLELDGKGLQNGRNVYGTNLLVRTTDGDTLFYMYNGHADVTALLKNDGTVAGTYYYDAFGNITEQTGSLNNNITYGGYQYDAEDGLYYLNARMYDPKIARFLQEDTYNGDSNDPLSLNLYTYCHNEPIMYSDPTGHTDNSSSANILGQAAFSLAQAFLPSLPVIGPALPAVVGASISQAVNTAQTAIAVSTAVKVAASVVQAVTGNTGVMQAANVIAQATTNIINNSSNNSVDTHKATDSTDIGGQQLVVQDCAYTNNWVKPIVDFCGFDYLESQDIYISKKHPVIQEWAGYNRLIDEISAVPAGMIIDCEPIKFMYNGELWMIELWKGQYDISTGAEIGVYKKAFPIGSANHYEVVDENDWLQMSFSLINKTTGKTVFTRSDRHWWLTGFKPGEFANPSDLYMNVNITFDDKHAGMLKAFTGDLDSHIGGLEGLGYRLGEPGGYDIYGNTVSFKYDRPKWTEQPWSTGTWANSWTQAKNAGLVGAYNLNKYLLKIKNNSPSSIQKLIETDWNAFKGAATGIHFILFPNPDAMIQYY